MRLLILFAVLAMLAPAWADEKVPVLVYHRFDPARASAATVVTTPLFVRQMEEIAAEGVTVVPMRALLARRDLPAHAVVITADDGFRSVYTEMFPVMRRLHYPFTLFINPPTIGAGAFMTAAEIKEMQASGLVDVEPHTLSHPDFLVLREKLAPAAFAEFVRHELAGSRAEVQAHFGGAADVLAWPYGIHDAALEAAAQAAGYVAAFALEGRAAVPGDPAFALPRYQVYETDQPARFRLILAGVPRRR